MPKNTRKERLPGKNDSLLNLVGGVSFPGKEGEREGGKRAGIQECMQACICEEMAGNREDKILIIFLFYREGLM